MTQAWKSKTLWLTEHYHSSCRSHKGTRTHEITVGYYQPPVTVGRDPGADLSLPNHHYGHASFSCRLGVFRDTLALHDMGGPTRIRIDGRELRQSRTTVSLPAVIQVGCTYLEISLRPPEPRISLEDKDRTAIVDGAVRTDPFTAAEFQLLEGLAETFPDSLSGESFVQTRRGSEQASSIGPLIAAIQKRLSQATRSTQDAVLQVDQDAYQLTASPPPGLPLPGSTPATPQIPYSPGLERVLSLAEWEAGTSSIGVTHLMAAILNLCQEIFLRDPGRNCFVSAADAFQITADAREVNDLFQAAHIQPQAFLTRIREELITSIPLGGLPTPWLAGYAEWTLDQAGKRATEKNASATVRPWHLLGALLSIKYEPWRRALESGESFRTLAENFGATDV